MIPSISAMPWTPRTCRSGTLHNAYRYALIFADGPAILFEFNGCEHLCRGLPGIDEIRPCVSWIYMAAAENVERQVKAWSGEIDELLRLHGGGNKRIAIDKIEPLGLKALESPAMSMSKVRSWPKRPAQ